MLIAGGYCSEVPKEKDKSFTQIQPQETLPNANYTSLVFERASYESLDFFDLYKVLRTLAKKQCSVEESGVSVDHVIEGQCQKGGAKKTVGGIYQVQKVSG